MLITVTLRKYFRDFIYMTPSFPLKLSPLKAVYITIKLLRFTSLEIPCLIEFTLSVMRQQYSRRNVAIRGTAHASLIPYPNVPVRCSLVPSPVDKFAEIASRDPNYVSPANK